MCRSMCAIPGGTSGGTSRRTVAGACFNMGGSRGGISSTGTHANLVGLSSPMRRMYSSALLGIGNGAKCSGHEATDTGLAYAPVSQAHGHHHTRFNVLPCYTAAQTSSVPNARP